MFQMLRSLCNVILSLALELQKNLLYELRNFMFTPFEYALINYDKVCSFGVVGNFPVAAQAVDELGKFHPAWLGALLAEE